MAIVNVRLDGHLENFVESFIRNGYASSKAEVLRAGVRELEMKYARPDAPVLIRKVSPQKSVNMLRQMRAQADMSDSQVDQLIISARKKRAKAWSDVH